VFEDGWEWLTFGRMSFGVPSVNWPSSVSSRKRSRLNHVIVGNESMNLRVDTLFADILDLFGSVDKIRRLRFRGASIRLVSIFTSSVGDGQDHVVGRGETMDLRVDSLFANVSNGFVDEVRWLRLGRGTVRLVGIFTSSVRDWKDHVVGGGKSVNFGVDSLFADVSNGFVDEVRWLRLGRGTVRLVGIFTSSVRDWKDHVVGGGKSVNFGVDSLFADVSNGFVDEIGRLRLGGRSVRLIGIFASSMRNR
jgi:hypothetical protein